MTSSRRVSSVDSWRRYSLFRHPAQEIVALRSLEELGSWLDSDDWQTEHGAFRGSRGERSADGWIG